MGGENKKLDKLILLAKKGDGRAQKKIFNQFSMPLLAICKRYSADTQEAEDMFIEGFTRIFEKIELYCPQEVGFYAWMKKVMINSCLNHLQKYEKENQILITEDFEKNFSEDIQIPSTYTMEQLLAAVESLSPLMRSVFNLYAIDEYTYREISIRLEISEAMVKTYIFRARKQLKLKLEQIKQRKG